MAGPYDPPAIVTPEAVALDLPVAGVGSRAVAIVLDWLIQGVLFVLVILGLSGLESSGAELPTWVGIALLVVMLTVVQFGYPIAFETLWHGRTPGKAALGLRVVTVEGGPIAFRHAAVRAALGLVDFLMTAGSAAVVSALVSRQAQRLGDLAAGTLVVRERVAGPPPVATAFAPPRGLEAFAAALDVSTLDGERYATVRTFLLRAPSLAPIVRTRLAADLATHLTAVVRPAPPAGVPAEAYLHCVAAAYQRRHAGWGVVSRAPVGTMPVVPAAPAVDDTSGPGPGGGFAPPA